MSLGRAISVGLLAHAIVLVVGGYDEVMGTIANIEAIVGAGVAVVAFVVGLPIWRRRTQPEDLTGQSAVLTQWMAMLAVAGMGLGGVGGLLVAVFGAIGVL